MKKASGDELSFYLGIEIEVRFRISICSIEYRTLEQWARRPKSALLED